MKTEPINYRNQTSFKGFYNNRTLLKSLEKISEHGTSFTAGVSLLSSLFIRPFAISITPSVEDENKKYASANSITSGLVKFAMVETIALPIENAVKNIDKNPEKFLNNSTIKNLKNGAEHLLDSKDYKFITQCLKSGGNFLTAIPKSVITIALIPVLTDKLFNKKENKKQNEPILKNTYDPVFAPFFKGENVNFKGNFTDKISKGIGSILNNKKVQNFALKFSKNDENTARNISMATDILLSTTSAIRIKKNDKIQEERKKPLIYNNLISTGITLAAGAAIDNLIKKSSGKFIKKFSEINKNDPNLLKYIEGINIVRPALIFASLYYGVLPVVSTFLAEKADKLTKEKIDLNG